MALVEWHRDLETGISVIDTQHKQIVSFINELDEACKTGNLEQTGHVMEGLLNYTVTHFEFEEDLQEKAGYPFLKGHRLIHENFMKKVSVLRDRAAKGENIAPLLLDLLKSWLVSHIKGEDRDYIESVRAITDSQDKDVTGWLNTALRRFKS